MSYKHYTWRGEPIHDLKKFCKDVGCELYTIEETHHFVIPQFSQEQRPDLYHIVGCECCDDGYETYDGPLVKGKEVSDTYEEPAVFFDNMRFSPDSLDYTYRIVKKEKL